MCINVSQCDLFYSYVTVLKMSIYFTVEKIGKQKKIKGYFHTRWYGRY